MSRTIITPRASQNTVTEKDILQGLSEIAEYLRAVAGGELPPVEHLISPEYTDGTPKPYSATDTHSAMVRKARNSWDWED